MKKLLYFCLLLTCSSLWAQEIKNSISLEGEWGFRIDSMDVGISEKWFSGIFESIMKLPGSMAENGLGYDVTPGARRKQLFRPLIKWGSICMWSAVHGLTRAAPLGTGKV